MRARGTLGSQECCSWLREPFQWGLQEEEPPNLVSSDKNGSEPGNKGQCHGFTKQPDIAQAVIYSENGGGQGSAEVTFNSAELESWDLWSDCLGPYNDLGLDIRNKAVAIHGHCRPGLHFNSSATQWPNLWPLRIQHFTQHHCSPQQGPLSMPCVVHFMAALPCLCLSLDTPLRVSGGRGRVYLQYPAYAALLGWSTPSSLTC